MTRSIKGARRAAVLLAVAASTSLLASGCGTGQQAETANKEPSVQGVNAQTRNNEYKVRGLLVEYPGPEGYKAGADAAVDVVLYNDTKNPVTVTVTTENAREIVLTGTAGQPAGSASPSPSESAAASPTAEGSASPSATGSPEASPSAAPAGEPARIEIPANGYVQLNKLSGRHLKLIGLNEAVRSGQNLYLTFDFGNGNKVTSPAPVAVPLSPQAPASPIIEREGGYENQEEGGEGGH